VNLDVELIDVMFVMICAVIKNAPFTVRK